MGRPLLLEAAERPATTAVIALCVCAWLYILHRRLGYDDVGMSYDKVVRGLQVWRLITCQLSHIDPLHLMFNASALWSLGSIETSPKMGTMYYLRVTGILLALSQLVCLGFYHVLIHVAKREEYARVTSVGYSCVAFGLMAILSVNQKGVASLSVLGLMRVPSSLAPFGSLIVTSLLIPKASFLGHLSGVLVGYVVGFGIFDRLTPFWAFSLVLWGALGLVAALVRSQAITLPFIRFQEEDDIETGGVARIVNGAVAR